MTGLGSLTCRACGRRNDPGATFCQTCDAVLDLVARPALGSPGPALNLVRPERERRHHPIAEGATSVGSSRRCDLVLDDVSVSARHATIRLTGVALVVTDDGSLNGIYVNGRRAEEAELKDGDELIIGRFRFVVLGAAMS